MPKEKIGIDKEWYSIEKLDKIIKNYNYWTKIIKRVHFIKYRYLGFSIAESAEKVGVSGGIGYKWQKIWNNSKNKTSNELFNMGNFGGPKPKLSDDDLNVLKELKADEMSVKDVKILIKKEFGVDFTEKHIRTSIIKKLKNIE